MSCSATSDHLDASRVTQLTVGELSLNSVTRFLRRRLWQTPSMTSQSITNPLCHRRSHCCGEMDCGGVVVMQEMVLSGDVVAIRQ
jgi:hypothetical protein